MADQQFQNIGNKGIYRSDISLRVLQVIENAGNLYTNLRFYGLESEYTVNSYILFFDGFFKLYFAVGYFTKDPGLLQTLEAGFKKTDVGLSVENANLYLDLFEEFVCQLKDAGIYDPTITHYYTDPQNAWEASI